MQADIEAETTLARTRSNGPGPKPKMPYFLTVLEDLIGRTVAATGTTDG